MSNFNLPIGQQIAGLRNALEISQRQLARRVGISDAYLCHIEKGRQPSNEQLEKIQAALGVRFDDPRAQQLFSLLADLRGDTANGH